MTPEQVALVTAILSFLSKAGGWPGWTFLVAVLVVPWVVALFVVVKKNNDVATILNQYKADMSEMRRMYENNVILVKEYQRLAGDLREVVMINTQTFSTLTEAISHNQFCPIVREKGGTK